MVGTAIRSHKIFISHSYRDHLRADYAGLVGLLDHHSKVDPSWHWENVSIPADAPVLDAGQARNFDAYVQAMRARVSLSNAILLIVRPESSDSESIFIENWEATPRRRENPPIIGVMPPGQSREQLGPYTGDGPPVSWSAADIVRAVRVRATAATPDELVLTPREAAERERIVNALEECDWAVLRAADALGISNTTLWRRMRAYIIDRSPAR